MRVAAVLRDVPSLAPAAGGPGKARPWDAQSQNATPKYSMPSVWLCPASAIAASTGA